jgi:hypothetical protein
MDLQEIEVFIDKDGQVRVEVRGVKGTQCLELTRTLEEALGGQVLVREMRPEAYDPQPEALPETIQVKKDHQK